MFPEMTVSFIAIQRGIAIIGRIGKGEKK